MTNMLLNTKKKSVFNTLMLLNSLLASLFLLNSLMTNLSVNTLMTNLSVNTCHWLHSNLSLNTWKRILSLITPMANHWPENNGVFFICWHYIVFQFISSLYQKKLVLYIFGNYHCWFLSCDVDKWIPKISTVTTYCLVLQIVSFICVLIDAHYQQLVLSPDSQEVLINLHRTVEGQVNNWWKILRGGVINCLDISETGK